jgi:hypothetical protein
MTDLDRYPSLMTFGENIDALAEQDATNAREAGRSAISRWLKGYVPVVRLAAAAVAVLIVAGGVYAAPPTRAAVSDVYSTFTGWFGGQGDGPGRPATATDDLPSWVNAETGDKRVLADAGGEKLVAIREDDKLTLALAGYAESDTIDGWGRQLRDAQLRVFAPGRFLPNGEHDQRSLFGLTAKSVVRVEFNYAGAHAPVSESGISGAFGLVIRTDWRPASLVAYGGDGVVITRIDFVTDPKDLGPGKAIGDFRYCSSVSESCAQWSS